MLQKAFDSNGGVKIAEFIGAIREGTMNERRINICKLAWGKLAPKGELIVSIDRLREVYDVTRNADFIAGTQTHEQIF